MNIFLSYNRQNSAFVSSVAERLRGITAIKELFFDQENLQGGQNWTEEIQQALMSSDACVVFIGEQGIGNWQTKEVLTAVNRCVESKGEFKIIPVIIPHSNREQVQKKIPWFLADLQWIEFGSETDPDAFQKLLGCLSKDEAASYKIEPGVIPYKGLDFFDVQDAPFFFGRTYDLNWIFYKKLRLESTNGLRFLAVVGDSGSGKSSFARAGVLATLKAGRFPGSEKWQQLIFSPEDNPLLKLAAALKSSGFISDAKEMEDEAKTDVASLRRALEADGRTAVLLIDQFEELVTQCKDNARREAFLQNLTEALKSQHFVCVVTLRSDFYAAFAPFREFADLLESGNYTIASLDYSTAGQEWERYLHDIIQKPARLFNVRFEPALVNQLIMDCKGINGVLPALQLALVELWKKGGGKAKIESADYDSLANGKGMAGVIEARADDVWNLLTRDGAERRKADLIKAVFIRLVEITANREDVRKTVKKAALVNELQPQFDPDEIENMLTALSGAGARLLRIKQDGASQNGSWVEVIHEVLIRQWEKLRTWLNERREAIAYRNKLELYIADDNKLLTGKRLAAAEQWITNNGDLATPKIKTFVAGSRKDVNKRKTVFLAGFGALLLLAVAAWLYYPVYQCRNCALVKKWEAGNYNVRELRTLAVSGTAEIKYLACFKQLDTVILQGKSGEDYLSQELINLLPKRVRQISITGFRTVDSTLTFSGFPQLHALKLSSVEGLQKLSIANADSLTGLTLSGLAGYKDLSGLRNLKSLQTLTLSRLNLSGLSGIEHLRNLQTLRLSALSNVTSLDELGNLAGLQTLTVSEMNVPDLKGVVRLSNLRTLVLSNLTRLYSIAGIENLKNLQTLELELHIDSLYGIQNLQNLRALSLTGLRIPDLAAVKNLRNLQTLTLSGMNIPNLSGIENLGGLRNLALLELNIPGLAELEHLRNLETLTLSGLRNVSGLEGLNGLRQLRTLALSNLEVSNLSAIQNAANLRSLTLVNLNNLSGLADIATLENLQSLTLSGLPLSDLADVKGLKSLRTLSIDFLPDLNLAGLENLTSLQSLSLSYLRNTSLAGIERLNHLTSLSLDNIGQPNAVFIPDLAAQKDLDTVALYGIKADNLDFLHEKQTIKVVKYDDGLTIANKEKPLAVKAGRMKQTKFLDVGKMAPQE